MAGISKEKFFCRLSKLLIFLKSKYFRGKETKTKPKDLEVPFHACINEPDIAFKKLKSGIIAFSFRFSYV